MALYEGQPLRGCELCGQVDDAPRHVVSTPPGMSGVPPVDMIRDMLAAGLSDQGLAALLDDSTQIRHMDCCAEAGCPAEPGKQCGDPERAGSGKRNDDLLLHIAGSERVQAEAERITREAANGGTV